MNREIITRWNNIVGENDLVYVLGDVFLGQKEELKGLVEQLNGRKILLTGNHDNLPAKVYEEAGFEKVYKTPFLVDGDFILSHYPLGGDLGRFYNIHGHRHTLPNETELSPRHKDIGVDNNHFCPYNLDKVKKDLYKADPDKVYGRRTIWQRIAKFLKMPFREMK